MPFEPNARRWGPLHQLQWWQANEVRWSRPPGRSRRLRGRLPRGAEPTVDVPALLAIDRELRSGLLLDDVSVGVARALRLGLGGAAEIDTADTQVRQALVLSVQPALAHLQAGLLL